MHIQLLSGALLIADVVKVFNPQSPQARAIFHLAIVVIVVMVVIFAVVVGIVMHDLFATPLSHRSSLTLCKLLRCFCSVRFSGDKFLHPARRSGCRRRPQRFTFSAPASRAASLEFLSHSRR